MADGEDAAADAGARAPRIAIAAGGTAGHVVPALAIADALRERGAEVLFLGGERAEAELVPAAGYPFHPLRVAGIDRRNPLKAARAVGLAFGATAAARKILARGGVEAVIGGGGYVGRPAGAGPGLVRLPARLARGASPLRAGHPPLAPPGRRGVPGLPV